MIDYEPRVSLKIFSSCSVVRRIDTLLDGVESRIDALATDYIGDIRPLYDDISEIRTLIHEADEPLVDKANKLWAENRNLKIRIDDLKEDLLDAKELIGSFAIDEYRKIRKEEQED